MTIITLLTLVGAGALIGVLYFTGLWLTLNKLTPAKGWGLWLGLSFLVRCSMTVAAFWFLAANDWRRIVAMATGFAIVRFISVKQLHLKSTIH